MVTGKAAVRFAKSLLLLAQERGELDEVQRDMELVLQAVKDSKDLELLLKSPVVKSDKKEAILKAVFDGKIGETSSSFIHLLTRKGRERLLPDCSKAFVDLAKRSKNIYAASVTTAVALDDATRAQVKSIVDKLSHQGAIVELEERIDPEILGGFIIRFGDQMVDTSVRTGIRNLRREFSDNPYVPEY